MFNILERFVVNKKTKKERHYVQIGTMGHVNGGRTRLIKLIMATEVNENGELKINIDKLNQNDLMEINTDKNQQIIEDTHKGIEIIKK